MAKEIPLCRRLLEVYRLVFNKKAQVLDVLHKGWVGTHWDFSLASDLHDWEVNTYFDFMEGIYQVVLHFGEEDRRSQGWENNYEYWVRSYYGSLSKTGRRGCINPTRWFLISPLKGSGILSFVLEWQFLLGGSTLEASKPLMS